MTRFFILLAPIAMIIGIIGIGCDKFAPQQKLRHDQHDRQHNDFCNRRHDDQHSRSEEYVVDELLHLHNEERGRHSAPKLTLNKDLEKAAREHAEWMARNDRLTHQGDNESDVQSRVDNNYRYIGENIAMGFNDPNEVMHKWMNSYGHKKNIVDKSYNKIGIGVDYAEDGTMYWCVVFAC